MAHRLLVGLVAIAFNAAALLSAPAQSNPAGGLSASVQEANALTDRLAIVSRGHVVVEGTAEELKGGLQGEAVMVELADGQVEEAASVVRALAEVREVSADGRVVRSRVADGARAVPTILAALDSRGIAG